jgi:hypothetical protein
MKIAVIKTLAFFIMLVACTWISVEIGEILY